MEMENQGLTQITWNNLHSVGMCVYVLCTVCCVNAMAKAFTRKLQPMLYVTNFVKLITRIPTHRHTYGTKTNCVWCKCLKTLIYWLQDLDNETLAHIDSENRRQTLEEQIEFLKSIHDQVRLTSCRIVSVECSVCCKENYHIVVTVRQKPLYNI